MINYSKFLRLEGDLIADTDLQIDRLRVLNPIVDGYVALAGSSGFYTNLAASSSTTNYTFRLPVDGGVANQFLRTDGAGNTNWAVVSLSPTLQEVYNNDVNGSDAIITTTATDGYVAFAGTEGVKVPATQGLRIQDGTNKIVFLPTPTPSQSGATITNSVAGTTGLLIAKTNTGSGLQVTNNDGYGGHFAGTGTNGISLYAHNSSTSLVEAVKIQGSATGSANALTVSNSSTGSAVLINQNSTSSSALEVSSLGTGISISFSPSFNGLNIIGPASSGAADRSAFMSMSASANPSAYVLELKHNNAGPGLLLSGANNFGVGLKAPTLAASYTLTLPTTAGLGSQFLQTDGSGVLSWQDVVLSGFTNTALSNLTTTSINESLLANADGTLNLGSPLLQWNNVFVKTAVNFESNGGVENTTPAATLNIGTSGNTSLLNLGTGSNTNVVNIGTGTGTTTINIGGPNDVVAIGGQLTWVTTTNLQVSDKLIVVNKGGALGSGDASGIAIEEDGYLEGYAIIGNSRASWDFMAPASDGTIRLTPSASSFAAEFLGTSITASRTYTLPNSSGTLLLSGQVNLATDVVGVLPLANGGTNNGSLTPVNNGVVYTDVISGNLSVTTSGITGQPLVAGPLNIPEWYAGGVDGPLRQMASGALYSGSLDLATEVTGLTSVLNGGTGADLSTLLAAGSIIYGDTTSAFGVSSVGLAGQPLLSGGSGVPYWFGLTGVVKSVGGVITTANVDLATEVDGYLPLSLGGTETDLSFSSPGGVVYKDASTLQVTSTGVAGQFLRSNGASPPTFDYPDKLFTTFTNNTGSTIVAGSVVILSQSVSGQIELANASALATCEGVAGIVFANILNGASGLVQTAGRATVTGSAFVLGKRVYVDTSAGLASSTAPSTPGTVIFVLGNAISTTEVLLNFKLETVN